MAYFNESKDGKVTVDFNIKAMPMPLYQKFLTMAEQQYGNCFWMTVASTMEKANIFDKISQEDMKVTEQFNEVWNKLEELEVKSKEKQEYKTLGGN